LVERGRLDLLSKKLGETFRQVELELTTIKTTNASKVARDFECDSFSNQKGEQGRPSPGLDPALFSLCSVSVRGKNDAWEGSGQFRKSCNPTIPHKL